MEKYDHFAYGQKLAQHLATIDAAKNYFEAEEIEELSALYERVTRTKGTILVAINGSNSDYRSTEADCLMEIPQFFFVVAQHSVLTDTASVIAAQQNSKRIAEQIIIRMLEDAKAYKRGLEYLDENSFSIRGYGPIGDTYFGALLAFNFSQSLTLEIDTDLWTEGGSGWD